MQLDVAAFQKLTGYSKRTVERAIATARDDVENSLIFRTCYSQRKWQILCSTVQRLDGLNMSEPFEADGKEKRIIKDHRSGTRIHSHQLALGPQKEFYGVVADESATDDEEDRAMPSTDPNQLEFEWNSKEAPWSERLEDSKANGATVEEQKEVARCYAQFLGLTAIFTNRQKSKSLLHYKGFPSGKQRNRRLPAHFNSQNCRGLAFHLLKSLKSCHYDNVKVRYEPKFAWRYAHNALMDGWTKKSIVQAYQNSLQIRHADATDEGIVYRPSSTVSLATEMLQKVGEKWRGK